MSRASSRNTNRYDTLARRNTCVEYLRRGSASSVAAIWPHHHPAPLCYAPWSSQSSSSEHCDRARPDQGRESGEGLLLGFQSLPFDDAAASHYAQIRNDLTTKGEIIGPNDLLIAAIVLTYQLVLVTHNTREFGRVVGLTVEDWQAP